MTRPASTINTDQALELVTDVLMRHMLEGHPALANVPPEVGALEKHLCGCQRCQENVRDFRRGASKILAALERAGILKEDF